MSRYTLEEEEQLATLKSFWSRHGYVILTAIIIACGAFAANNAWKWWQARQAANAVAVFEQLELAIVQKNADLIKKSQQNLVDNHARSPYTQRGALMAAKVLFSMGDKNAAKSQLQWAVDHAKLDEYAATARLMLSGMLIDEKMYEKAKNLVLEEEFTGFGGLFQDRLGDIATAQKKYDVAREAYQKALKLLQPKSPWVQVVERKLAALPKTGE